MDSVRSKSSSDKPARIPASQRPCCFCHERPRVRNQSWCQVCHNEYLRTHYDPEKQRDRMLRSTFNLTAYEYDLMLFQQGGVCAVCKQPETARHQNGTGPRALAVDHNHQTGQVREILCTKCNVMLGEIERDPERAAKLLKYLKKHDM